MTVIGIVGCTILMITGYGIKDSITGIADKQFNEVLAYDDLVYVDENETDLNKEEPFTNEHIKVKMKSRLDPVNVGNTSVVLHSIDDVKNMNEVVKGKSIKTGKEITLESNKVVISDKLANMHKIKIGDKIKFEMVNNKTYEFEVSDIFANYVASHIFMDKDTYDKHIGTYKQNVTYLKLDNIENEDSVLKEVLDKDAVISFQRISTTMNSVNNMLTSLDKVVIILIILSGALSFVVLYNLSYINISERRREIATLKVLGFYNGEVDNYIIKENFIITLIGIFIGLILSKPFVDFIVDSIEIDLVKFIHNINLISYIYSFSFLILFTIIVSIIIHFALKKIDMIESLKSVE
jgi:putative ABC transport system permease protein